MHVIDKIKDLIFKIKDYDRLESDYCTCLCYFTNNKMSKPNYKIETVKEVILESVGEYRDEGYNMATQKAIEWLEENIRDYAFVHSYSSNVNIDIDTLIEDLQKAMEEEEV